MVLHASKNAESGFPELQEIAEAKRISTFEVAEAEEAVAEGPASTFRSEASPAHLSVLPLNLGFETQVRVENKADTDALVAVKPIEMSEAPSLEPEKKKKRRKIVADEEPAPPEPEKPAVAPFLPASDSKTESEKSANGGKAQQKAEAPGSEESEAKKPGLKKNKPRVVKKSKAELYHETVLKIESIDLTDVRKLINNPPPAGRTYQLTVVRNKSGFTKKFFPIFNVYFSENMNISILNAKKKSGNKTSNYIISLSDSDFDRKSPNCVGKLRSNFVGTEFMLFDTGENPKKKKLVDPDSFRRQLLYIRYEKNLFGMKGPRKFSIVTPRRSEKGVERFTEESDETDLGHAAKNLDLSRITMFKNNPPQWSDEHEAYVLDFFNRVEKPSVKNFQLVEDTDADTDIVIQFGKVNDNTFNLDVRAPFSPLQAVALALSSCDNKLFCE